MAENDMSEGDGGGWIVCPPFRGQSERAATSGLFATFNLQRAPSASIESWASSFRELALLGRTMAHVLKTCILQH
jgi:hypothetical protein